MSDPHDVNRTMGIHNETEATVDVILTCYNEGPYIGQAIRSVLDQTRADRIGRIIIADDGSQAETLAILKDIESWDLRIAVLYGPGGVRVPGQRNLAIAQSTAPFIAILDGDDYWTPRKLELQLPLVDSDSDGCIGLVYSDYFTFPGDDPSLARRCGAHDLSGAENLSRAFFLCDPPIIPSSALIRRSVFDAAGRFDASIHLFEDTECWLRLARHCRFGFVSEPLVYKRSHPASLTGGRRDVMKDHALIALKAVSDDPALLPLVPRRLSERARKLGNYRFLQGDAAEAARLLRIAIQLNPFNFKAWPSWVAAAMLPRLSARILDDRLRARRKSMGLGR